MATDERHLESLPELMADVYGRYAKEVILDRALPDARDGLKPSQRRILYGMAEGGHSPDRPYVKSARVVGDVMGHYHPHGDSSIYGALVRMSQWWVAPPLVDLSGNGGSLDDDPPAAMRYTEVRLAPLAMEMVRDLDRDTVPMQPNFDESEEEPEVLPCYFPALLTLGASGVAVGFASEIPPHNLGEAIDAAAALAVRPELSDDELARLLPGPDFPTGGIVIGTEAARAMERTGQGKVRVRARVRVEDGAASGNRGKTLLVISEIPYRVVKSQLVAEIDRIRAARQVEGLLAVRDESDHEDPVRVVVELRQGTDPEAVLDLLYRKTSLERSYSANMTAIVDGRPRQAGVRELLQAYLGHLREVIRRRTACDLRHAEERLHILEGLIRAADDLDGILHAIRTSASRKEAHARLVAGWGFTDVQAEAILLLQLYRLTNLEIETLRKESDSLRSLAASLRLVLEDESRLTLVLTDELRDLRRRFARPRRTDLRDEDEAPRRTRAELLDLAPAEEVVVAVSALGDVKRVPVRSYQRGEAEGVRDGDSLRWVFGATTRDTVLFVFQDGHLFAAAVRDLQDRKWREAGQNLATLLGEGDHGRPIQAFRAGDAQDLLLISTSGYGRLLLLDSSVIPRRRGTVPTFPPGRDQVALAEPVTAAELVFIVTSDGQALLTRSSDFPRQGRTAGGVRAIRLGADAQVAAAATVPETASHLLIVGARGGLARFPRDAFSIQRRGGAGVQAWTPARRNPEPVLAAFAATVDDRVRLLAPQGIVDDIPVRSIRTTGRGKPPAAHSQALLLEPLTAAFFLPRVVADPDAH